ncbi:hypothetical protein [Bacillus mycoides]|uniref:hypothetical protein n=1 Tax=Bacillus mycoides TaxID=1405 RepID=UPI001C020636|nr:hypothetical protein [Bacillus mycoides]MED1383876.1 hypothetical protein [Bacillus mycoides]QWI47207.1 hypothetical protein EXW55_30680 [Bacillus mycoides]
MFIKDIFMNVLWEYPFGVLMLFVQVIMIGHFIKNGSIVSAICTGTIVVFLFLCLFTKVLTPILDEISIVGKYLIAIACALLLCLAYEYDFSREYRDKNSK